MKKVTLNAQPLAAMKTVHGDVTAPIKAEILSNIDDGMIVGSTVYEA
ncbi:MAG: hypothetical protein U1C96_01395 [Gallionella sp.]|nr:hypothetical protein [Gallionella sp.]